MFEEKHKQQESGGYFGEEQVPEYDEGEDDDEQTEQFLVDRQIRYPRSDDRRPSFFGYGNGAGSRFTPTKKWQRGSPPRLPKDVCIVCRRKGCHSSKHRIADCAARAFLQGVDSENEEDSKALTVETDDETPNNAWIMASCYISANRSQVGMNAPININKYVVDAAVIDRGCSLLSTAGCNLVSGLLCSLN